MLIILGMLCSLLIFTMKYQINRLMLAITSKKEKNRRQRHILSMYKNVRGNEDTSVYLLKFCRWVCLQWQAVC